MKKQRNCFSHAIWHFLSSNTHFYVYISIFLLTCLCQNKPNKWPYLPTAMSYWTSLVHTQQINTLPAACVHKLEPQKRVGLQNYRMQNKTYICLTAEHHMCIKNTNLSMLALHYPLLQTYSNFTFKNKLSHSPDWLNPGI